MVVLISIVIFLSFWPRIKPKNQKITSKYVDEGLSWGRSPSDVFNKQKNGYDPNQLHSPFSRFQKTTKKQKNSDFGDFYFFRFFQPPMSNLQKNHVKIDVFKEPKYHFDPNQVQSTSFRAHKTPNKQKNSAFVTFFFGSKCLRCIYS